jgi:translation elongation factor EF-G
MIQILLSKSFTGQIFFFNFFSIKNEANFTIPLINTVGYATYLRSVSSGQIEFLITNYGYDVMSMNKQERTIKKLMGIN